MKKVLVLLPLILVFSSFQKIKYVKTKINDDISISLPADFVMMDETELNRRFVSAKKPLAMFTDYARTVELGVNMAYSRWRPDDLDIMKSFYKSNIMGLYDEVNFLQEGIENINGRDFAVFEFVSVIRDDDDTAFRPRATAKFTRIQYTIVNYKTVLFNFTCDARQKDQWIPIARHIMSSVKISKTL